MELMKQEWTTIMLMPYQYFLETLKWKVDLEEEKRKKMEEKTKTRKSYNRKVEYRR